jgi:curved DNA-binding protein CbpA
MSEQTHEHDEACMEIIKTKCYYEVLKIDKSANQDEIRRAYKKVSLII